MNTPEPEEYDDIKEIQEKIQNGTSIRRCAKEYGISESTLRGRLKGVKTHHIPHQNQQLLSPQQEEEIVSFIRHEETCGRALTKAELRELANAIAYPDSTDLKVSRHWALRFLRRHENIKIKNSEPLEYSRSKETTPESIRQFYDDLAQAALDLSVGSNRMYNMDQHGLQELDSRSGKVLGDASTSKSIVTNSDNRNWVTIIESGNAQGVALPPTVVFSGKHLQEQWFPNEFPDWGYDTTKNGWASQAVCLKWLRETFLPKTKPEKPMDWRILVVDGFAGHISAQFRFLALFYRVQVMYLPPHSSHITQPYDVGVFSPLKAAFRRLARKFAGIRSNNAIGKQRFLKIYKKARDEALTAENIISGFRGAGIWPIDVEKPLSKIIISSEPPGTNTLPATPQHQRVVSRDVPYTPQNKIQLLNQLNNIKSRQTGYERDYTLKLS